MVPRTDASGSEVEEFWKTHGVGHMDSCMLHYIIPQCIGILLYGTFYGKMGLVDLYI